MCSVRCCGVVWCGVLVVFCDHAVLCSCRAHAVLCSCCAAVCVSLRCCAVSCCAVLVFVLALCRAHTLLQLEITNTWHSFSWGRGARGVVAYVSFFLGLE